MRDARKSLREARFAPILVSHFSTSTETSMEHELWSELSAAMFDVARAQAHRAGARFTHSHERVVRVYLWAVLHDRPVSWACDARNWACDARNWTGHVRPPDPLPSQSTMSRRTRTQAFEDFLDALGAAA
jgi:hypothetical protein